MLLGENECGYDYAHFIENGKFPPIQRRCTRGEVSISDAVEREWDEPNMQYQLWRGCRFGSMDWIQ